MGEISNFFVTIGAKINRTQWNGALSLLKDFRLSFFNIGTAITAADAGLILFESKVSQSLTRLSNASKILNVPVNQLQALQLVAKQTQIPFQSLAGAIGTFQNAYANLSVGNKFPDQLQMGFGMLSNLTHQTFNFMKYKNNPEGAFKQFFAQLSRLNVSQREGILNETFGNSDLEPLVGHIDLVDKAYKQLKSRGLLFSNSDMENARAYSNEIALISTEFSTLASKVGLKLMPAFAEFSKQLLEISSNKNFINSLEIMANLIERLVINIAKIVSHINDLYVGTQHINDKLYTAGVDISDFFNRISSALTSVADSNHNGVGLLIPNSNSTNINNASSNDNNSKVINTTNNNTTNNTTHAITHIHTYQQQKYISGVLTGGVR